MGNIAFNLIISKGFENMFGISKGQWKVVMVAIVAMLLVMYALTNVDALEDVAEKVGLDV